MSHWSHLPIEYWITALDGDDQEHRWVAVDAIRHRCALSTAMPLYVKAFGDPYWKVRALAIHAIADLLHGYKMDPDCLSKSELNLISSQLAILRRLQVEDADPRVCSSAEEVVEMLTR